MHTTEVIFFFRLIQEGEKKQDSEVRRLGKGQEQNSGESKDSGFGRDPLSERGRNNTVKQPSKEPFVIMDQNEEMHIKKQVPWRKLTKCRKMTMNTELLPHGCQALQNQISENPNP